MAYIHGSVSLVCELGALIVFMLGKLGAVMDFTEMNRMLGNGVTTALMKADITILQASETMRIDESQFRRALKGEGYRLLALNHLIKLGPLFMAHLCAELMWLTARQRAMEIAESLETLKVRKDA